MRFVSLALERYGPFTDRVLAFDAEARLTVIHGGNEAGKTTALAAVTDVLFGIEERSRFNFLHEYKTMRLGATIAGHDGRTLSFARLKRRTGTLVDPESGDFLPDDSLAPFLGAHDRRAFTDIYGLDQSRLRDGGRKLLAGGGDLARTLLTAAPGLSHVARLRDELKESAALILNPERRSASHAFHRALDRRKQARDSIRALELSVNEVKAAREEATEAAQARREAEAAERDARKTAARAQMLARAVKEIRALDAYLAERATLGEPGTVPPGFTAQARAALEARDEAQRAAGLATEEENTARLALEAIAIDASVLALAERIEAADEERAAVAKELASLPNRRDEASRARANLARIAAGLGLADVEALRARLPGPPLLARAGRLVDGLRALALRAGALDEERRKLVNRRARLQEARDRLGHAADPAPVKRRLVALEGAEEREQNARLRALRLETRRQELTERVGRLAVPVSDPDALAALELPALAAVEASLRRIKEARDARDRLEDARAALDEQLAQARARLDALNAGRPAPTTQAIASARRLRNDLWATLRPLSQGERPATDHDRQAAQDFEHALAEADLLADERLTETARLADLAQTTLAIGDLEVRLLTATRRASEAQAQLAQAGAHWHDLWKASGLTPADGEAMPGFLREAALLIEARSAIRAEAADIEALHALVREDRAATEALRSELGLPALGAQPLRMAELRIAAQELETRFQEARDHERDLRLIQQQETDHANRETEHATERENLAREAAEIFPLLAIRPMAPAEEAQAALELWREAPTQVSDLDTAERRIAGIEADRDAFIARAQELARLAAPENPQDEPSPPDSFISIRRLRARLDAARQARSRADLATAEFDRRRRALAEAVQRLERAQAALGELAARAGLDDPGDLAPLVERLDRAEALDEQVRQARSRLADMAGAQGEDDIRLALAHHLQSHLEGHDDDALAILAAQAEASCETARTALGAAIERDTRAAGALAEIERRPGAAAAAQEEQDAFAEIADAAERFARDHVAARLLTLAIERYREKHQNPIVERASRVFEGLTGGRWNGIGIDYDEEPPRLAALREGRLLGVDALSEGTADQLFLALRVAAIEEHARSATPLPFVADDLFISFDEARTAAGLRLLAELGALAQVLVFTHHEHVVACAEHALGERARIIRL